MSTSEFDFFRSGQTRLDLLLAVANSVRRPSRGRSPPSKRFQVGFAAPVMARRARVATKPFPPAPCLSFRGASVTSEPGISRFRVRCAGPRLARTRRHRPGMTAAVCFEAIGAPCPTGKSLCDRYGMIGDLSSLSRKNILLFGIENQPYIHPRPVPPKGAARDRHGRGAGCGGR
jgi:hypothetical protein